MRFLHLSVLLIIFTLLSGLSCSKKMIPNSEIEDTPENRELYNMIKTYHEAVEARNIDLLLPLLSASYYEDNGTVKGDDDYGLEELKTKLKTLFNSAKAIRLSLYLEDLKIENQKAEMKYTYEIRYQISYPDGDKWSVKEDSNVIEFSRISGAWKISSGI